MAVPFGPGAAIYRLMTTSVGQSKVLDYVMYAQLAGRFRHHE